MIIKIIFIDCFKIKYDILLKINVCKYVICNIMIMLTNDS